MKRVGVPIVVAALAAACGEMAVDGHYAGEPLLEIAGTVTLDASNMPAGVTGELRVALFWARPAAGTTTGPIDTVTALEQDVGAASSFPARYTLTVHTPPPAALIGTASDVTGRFASAMLLVYLDVDRDGAWDRGAEELVGAAADALVVWAPDGLAGGRFGELAPGFHVLRSSGGGPACNAALADVSPSDVPIVVDMLFPAAALGDIDCDGVVDEWSGTCPSPATVNALCRAEAAESSLCETCEPLLWDDGSPDSGCDTWLTTCDQFASSHECEEAWEHCREEGEDDEEDCVEGSPGCVEEPEDA